MNKRAVVKVLIKAR